MLFMMISIFSSVWWQNLWDELILKNEIKILEKKYSKDTKFVVFSYDPQNPFLRKSNIVYKEYFPIWIRKFSNILINIKNFYYFFYYVFKSDLIVIWWGWIIYDTENQSTREPLDQWLFRSKVFNFFNKKVLFFSVWLNIKNQFNYHKVKEIFSGSEVTVRDSYSQKLLKELWVASTIVRDPVFSEVIPVNRKSMIIKRVRSYDFTCNDLSDINLEWKKVALAIRKWYLIKSWLEKNNIEEDNIVNEIIDYILKKWWEVILLPHSFHKTDYLANDYLFLNINQKVRIVSSMQDVYNKYIYKEFDLCLAMRLHSIILSQVYWIPFVWISYSKKTDETLDYIESLN